MAGIAGYFGAASAPEVLQAMVRKLAHRGPDGEAFYLANPVFMGLRDTAAAAAGQPAYSPDESIAVLVAGRISNYGELREDLARKGMMFRNDSLPELVLHLYEAYGPSAAGYLRGKFVVAVHDVMKDLVLLARDHMGAEPLYYTTTQSGSFVFASEIKALLEHPGVQVVPDMVGIDAYLSLGYSPGPNSLFRGIHKLPAGHRLIWNPGLHVLIEPYWQWDSFMTPDPALKTDADFQAEFDRLFDDAVRAARAGCDRPGVILTGAAEESAIAAALARQGQAAESFAIGFEGGMEALAPARTVARKLGTRHHETVCHPSDMEKLPEIVWALDEPVADADVLMQHLLAQRARRETGTLLSGAGADDLLFGLLPQRIFMAAHQASPALVGFYRLAARYAPRSWLDRKIGGGQAGAQYRERLSGFLEAMRNGTPAQRYAALIALFDARDKTGLYSEALSPVMETFIDKQRDSGRWPSVLSAMLALQKDYAVQDHAFMRLDKMTMLASVEARAPFADHPLVEFLLAAPDHLKYHAGRDKVLLRNYLEAAMPGLPERAAAGPALPLAGFMATQPLREMIDTCLSEASVKRRGLFEWEGLRRLLLGARGGDALCLRQTFALLMLELWFRIYVDHEKGWISG